MEQYLNNQFPTDLRTLQFTSPNQVIQENLELFQVDQQTIFFGGQDWSNFEQNIAQIEQDNLNWFFLCLFTITTIDVILFTHFQAYYPVFRGATRYPKFGWTGFGVHFENPKKLLTVPEAQGRLNRELIDQQLDEYLPLLVNRCDVFFAATPGAPTTLEFLTAILEDTDFVPTEEDQGTFYSALYNRIQAYAREQQGAN